MKSSSCGPCASKGDEILKTLSDELEIDLNDSEKTKIDQLKSKCKILLKYPEEYEEIDPYGCKFFMPSALKFF
jgi:DNA polymerase III sliding clamp (beta) subunit (PCNA family)